MKMIIAILRDIDTEAVSEGLVEAGFRVTRVASTGGFLRRGSNTLMIGVQDDKVDEAIGLIRLNTSPSDEVNHRSATLFVLNVSDFHQI